MAAAPVFANCAKRRSMLLDGTFDETLVNTAFQAIVHGRYNTCTSESEGGEQC
jgi:hypothetical protein